MHFWAEFYLPRFGWLPVDINYGDEPWGIKETNFYFGNMDNLHIAFSKGKVDFHLPDSENQPKTYTLAHLQKYHAYMKNKAKDKNYQITRYLKKIL